MWYLNYAFYESICAHIYKDVYIDKGVCGIIVIEGNGHSDTSSNPGQDWLHFT